MKRATVFQIIICAVLAVLAIIMIFPFIWMVLTSFKSMAEISQANTFLPAEWTLDNYADVFDTVPFMTWLKNSVLVTVIATVIVLFSSTIVGFVFGKFQFPGKNICFWFILATMMVPSQTTMIPSFLLINSLGMYDKLSSLVVPGMIGGFGIFLCKQFIEEIPDSLCEAAVIDGAGSFYIYAKIILPLIRPAIGALTIFTFLRFWNDYLNPLLYINQPENMTLSLAISFFSTQHGSNVGAIMAVSTLVMIPVTVVFLAFQKQFIKGIAITGMK